MDTIKIGGFLQELRKEKGLTQERLAEQLGVARRTVSRWETGYNMPDFDILIDLSDLYGVDLREILNGCRNTESSEQDIGETMRQVADITKDEKARFTRRVHWLFIVGLVGLVATLALAIIGAEAPVARFFIGFGIGWGIVMMLIGALLTRSSHCHS